MMSKGKLEKLYLKDGFSVSQIADKFSVSEHKINYWLSKYNIKKRTISEAMYLKLNPNGDPFCYQAPRSRAEWVLFGLGIGLFWGEGNKRNKSSIRLGNTDPRLIRTFLIFLDKIFRVNRAKLRFGLQVFSDISPEVARKYWMEKLNIPLSQFHKVIVTPTRNIGTYKYKSKYGVLTVHFANTKLKKAIDKLIENFPPV